ncbi:MAG: glycogen synthase GlgA [Myxococcales bacterium]|nr:glycogen synthase GlgA [Myxococcales bacterium]
MHIVFVASEMAPYAKTGGLADVAGSLPAELANQGVHVSSVLPRYGVIDPLAEGFVYLEPSLVFGLAGATRKPHVWHRRAHPNHDIYLLEEPGLYDRPGLYGMGGRDFADNDYRFAFLCRATLALVRALRINPDVIHCNDWQTGIIPWACGREMAGVFPTVFTIHNMGYQGLFGQESMWAMGLHPSGFTGDGYEYYGAISCMKAGVMAATRITTVSKRYAYEIQTPEFGFGMDAVLRGRQDAIVGILNGVDYSQWDPLRDRLLPAMYGPEDLSGKHRCRALLLREFDLEQPREGRGPVVGVVSRLTGQKGIDLIIQSAWRWLSGTGARLVVLGNGSKTLQDQLRGVQGFHPDQVGLRFEYNEELAHLMYAGCDMLLMPSKYEPCGLNQLYAMRYGTIPVVRATGGLDDTVEHVRLDQDTGTGFKFEHATADGVTWGMWRAIEVFRQPGPWTRLVRRAMAQDFSWSHSAQKYIALYRSIAGAPLLEGQRK